MSESSVWLYLDRHTVQVPPVPTLLSVVSSWGHSFGSPFSQSCVEEVPGLSSWPLWGLPESSLHPATPPHRSPGYWPASHPHTYPVASRASPASQKVAFSKLSLSVLFSLQKSIYSTSTLKVKNNRPNFLLQFDVLLFRASFLGSGYLHFHNCLLIGEERSRPQLSRVPTGPSKTFSFLCPFREGPQPSVARTDSVALPNAGAFFGSQVVFLPAVGSREKEKLILGLFRKR